MGITVRRAKKPHGSTARNWCVEQTHDTFWRASISLGGRGTFPVADRWERLIRTYTCTNFTDAMRIADDLACDRAIDPWRVIALSERRVN